MFLDELMVEISLLKEAKYHLKCLTSVRNRYRSHVRKLSQEEEEASTVEENMNRCRAFVELVGYIEKSVESGTSFFKLTEIHSLYVDCLKHFGISKEVHKTRLKKRLLEHFPEAQEQHDGKNIISFTAALRRMLREAVKKRNFSEDAAVLAKAASLVRTDIFNQTSARFTGCFHKNSKRIHCL